MGGELGLDWLLINENLLAEGVEFSLLLHWTRGNSANLP